MRFYPRSGYEGKTNAERWVQQSLIQDMIESLVAMREDIAKSMRCECFPEDQELVEDDYFEGQYCEKCGYMLTRKWGP